MLDVLFPSIKKVHLSILLNCFIDFGFSSQCRRSLLLIFKLLNSGLDVPDVNSAWLANDGNKSIPVRLAILTLVYDPS